MSHTFVPLVASPSSVSPGSAPANPASLPRQSFSPVSSAPPVPQAEENRSVPGSHQPTIKVHKEGDTVRRIQIHCSCGQVIEVECQY